MALTIKNLDRCCLAVVALATVLSGYLVISKGIEGERSLGRDRERLAKSAESMRQVEANIGVLRSNVRTGQKELADLDGELLGSGQIGEFIKALGKSVRQRGIVLVSVQPQKAIEGGPCRKIPVQVECRGTFTSLYRFLVDLETAHRLTIVQKLVIGEGDLPGLCQLDLTAILFAREPKAGKGQARP